MLPSACCLLPLPLLLQVPLEELDLRRLREAAEEMREQLSLTSKAVRRHAGAGATC